MAQDITIDIDDDLFSRLTQNAEARNQSLEQMIRELVIEEAMRCQVRDNTSD